MLISVHVPKTAGLSFLEVLKGQFGSGLVIDTDFPELTIHYAHLRPVYPRISLALPDEREGIRCVHAHAKATTLRRLFPTAQMAIWFREPLQRCLSHYHHLRRVSAWVRFTGLRLVPRQVGLRVFMRLPEVRNYYGRVLDGLPLEAFDFVGITERFDESVALYRRLLGGDADGPPAARRNTNPAQAGKAYEPSDDLRQLFTELNQADLALYQAAVQRFEVLRGQHELV